MRRPDLLFTAEVAGQEARWSNVDRGSIIGVFADPRAVTPGELAASALTVWLRINRKASHLQLRWRDGLYLPHVALERGPEMAARRVRRRASGLLAARFRRPPAPPRS